MDNIFRTVREPEDDGLEDIFEIVKQLSGQYQDKSTTAVLRNQIDMPELTGSNSDDIIMLHKALSEVINTIKGG